MINADARNSIVAAFGPLTARTILEVADELDQDDRIAFDEVVFNAFGITVAREVVYDSLRALTEIRQSVNA